MLEGESAPSVKRAVFLAEWAYYEGTVDWYGDYSFLGNWDIPSATATNSPTGFDANAPQYGYGSKQTTLESGFLTGTMERIIGKQSNNPYIWSVMYYDNRGRTVQQSRKNPMGGWDKTNTGYSYTGQPLKSRTVHFAGRLIQDNRNNANALKTSYDYNLRNWAEVIAVGWNTSNASYGNTFLEELRYQNTVPSSQNPVQWSGNISSMDWTCGNDSVTRMYEFTYDGLSRLTNAVYGDSQNNSGTYSRAYTYDLHGNILSLTTPSGTVNVSYSGNRRAGSYTYDSNGNLTSDQDAGLTGMTYNALNLLSGYTHSADGYDTRITYTASGEKTDVFTEDNQIVASHWHRFGNLIYDGSFSYTRLLVDGGYVDISNAGYTYRFYIQDHQGNNRMVTDDGGTVLQVNHYDPYGQLLAPISSTSAVSEYKYGGKEWSDVTLSYDFGARNYLPSIPRWSTMDPLAEKYYSLSPYVYCAGNPVNLVDEDGKVPRIYIQTKGIPGHAFITTGEGKNTIVYTYGRYGTLFPGTSGKTSGVFTRNGEGVLLIKTGDSAESFLAEVMNDGDGAYSIYELPNADEEMINTYFHALFYNGTSPTNPQKNTYNDSEARVIDEYDLINNNCVSMTKTAARIAGASIESNSITPAGFDKDLSKQSQRDDNLNVIYNPVQFVDYLLWLIRKENKVH